MSVRCIFEETFSCYDKNPDFAPLTKARLGSIIRCSKERKDKLYVQLCNDAGSEESYSSHPSCIKTYTSKVIRHTHRA